VTLFPAYLKKHILDVKRKFISTSHMKNDSQNSKASNMSNLFGDINLFGMAKNF
jgi:hypothetical protein